MQRYLLMSLICLFFLSGTASAYYLDAPHNEANGIQCSTCHSHPVWSGTFVPQNIDDTAWNTVCNDCHGVVGSDIHAGLHSDLQINGSQNWTTQCINCHNTHFQDQYRTYANSFPSQVYLVDGELVSGSPIVDNGNGTTTIQYVALSLPAAPWDNPALWGNKGGFADSAFAADGSRGLIFATTDPASAQLYEVIFATGTIDPITGNLDGSITLKGQTTYQGDVGLISNAKFGLIYGQLIKRELSNIDTHGQGIRSVKFFSPIATPIGPGGFADNTPGSTSPEGICQVCHPTTLAHWNTDNSGDGPANHHAAENCATCHDHSDGYASPPPVAATCTPDILALHDQTILSGQKINVTATNILTVGPAYSVNSGATVSLAGKTVTLLAGFTAQEGSHVIITSDFNHAPIAFDDNIQVVEGGTVTGNVLANDNDVDCDLFIAKLVDQVSNGMLLLNEDGSFTYTHNGSETTHDQFTYKAVDDNESKIVTAYITIIPANDAPSANNDLYTVDKNSSQLLNVLGNDIDVDYEDVLTISSVSNTNNGLSLVNNGTSVTYTPATNFIGQETFSYTIQDSTGESATATVTVNVIDSLVCNNSGLVLHDELVSQDLDITYRNSIALGPAYTILAGVKVTLNSNAISLLPGFRAEHGSTVQLMASPWEYFNAAPVAEDDSFMVNEGEAVTANVLLNDRDSDCDSMKAVLVSKPRHGVIGLNIGDEFTSFTYQHDGSETTHDSFTYYAKDAEISNTVTVSITVNPMNDAPVANDDTFYIYSYDPIQLDVLANDYDLDPGDILTISSVGQPVLGGQVSNNSDSITYTPAADLVGMDSFTYTVVDGKGKSAMVTVYIGNTPPVAIAQNVVTNEFAPIQIVLTGTDFDHDPLDYEILTAPERGTISGAPPFITFSPKVVPSGSVSFTFTVSDSMYTSPPVPVSITVNHVPKVYTTDYEYDDLGRITGKTVRVEALK